MSTSLSPMTELEAVNAMLSMIGESPVNSLRVSSISEATIAQNMLKNISREIQMDGLHCNTEEGYPLVPDINGNIIVPSNVLKIDSALNVVQRGDKLYNKDDHTFVFSEKQDCYIVWFLSYEDLPQHVRHYIVVRAARKFQVQQLGSDTIASLSEEDEASARVEMIRAELNTGNYNLLASNDVRKITSRTTNPKVSR
jgi:hypothetical protein